MRGLIHIYCGDGKGKTTASMGLAVRAAGSGMKVMIVQFLKGQPTGELNILGKLPNVTILRGKSCGKFSFAMNEEEKRESREGHNQCLRQAIDAAKNGECDLLILDEIMAAISCGLIDTRLIFDFAADKPEALELVMTGRNPPEQLVELADYVSEIKKVKHPYDRGIEARTGIEK